MRIRTEPDDTGIAPAWARWSAIDDDSYEGPTPDEPGSPIGYGETADEAIADLVDKLAEEAEAREWRRGMSCRTCYDSGVVPDVGSVFPSATVMCPTCCGRSRRTAA